MTKEDYRLLPLAVYGLGLGVLNVYVKPVIMGGLSHLTNHLLEKMPSLHLEDLDEYIATIAMENEVQSESTDNL